MSLVFASKRGGTINDLKRGIQRCLSRFYHYEVCMRMCSTINANYLFSRDRKQRCIVLTADDAFTAGVLLDLAARLSQQGSQLRTPLATYEVTIEGVTDAHRLMALSAHYFWMNSYFERHVGRTGERYLLN